MSKNRKKGKSCCIGLWMTQSPSVRARDSLEIWTCSVCNGRVALNWVPPLFQHPNSTQSLGGNSGAMEQLYRYRPWAPWMCVKPITVVGGWSTSCRREIGTEKKKRVCESQYVPFCQLCWSQILQESLGRFEKDTLKLKEPLRWGPGAGTLLNLEVRVVLIWIKISWGTC